MGVIAWIFHCMGVIAWIFHCMGVIAWIFNCMGVTAWIFHGLKDKSLYKSSSYMYMEIYLPVPVLNPYTETQYFHVL